MDKLAEGDSAARQVEGRDGGPVSRWPVVSSPGTNGTEEEKSMHLRRRAGLAAVSAVLLVTLLSPQAAHAQAPTITVTPNTGLTDGQAVTVTGTGFGSDLALLLQCVAGAEAGGARFYVSHCAPFHVSEFDQQGNLVPTQFTVSETIATLDDGQVDCTTSRCEILVIQGDPVTAFDSAFLFFRPPTATPTTKAHCRTGDWRDLVTDAGLPFRNLGDCVSFVGPRSGANPTG
jgi:hypothetical protein